MVRKVIVVVLLRMRVAVTCGVVDRFSSMEPKDPVPFDSSQVKSRFGKG